MTIVWDAAEECSRCEPMLYVEFSVIASFYVYVNGGIAKIWRFDWQSAFDLKPVLTNHMSQAAHARSESDMLVDPFPLK